MLDFVAAFFGFLQDLYNTVNVSVFEGVGFLDILVGFMVISFVVSVFWKGARA